MRFRDLLQPSLPDASQQQKWAASVFPEVIGKTSLRLWRPGDRIAGGLRLLVGAAVSYSVVELEMLDELAAVDWAKHSVSVDVFDVGNCSPNDLESYIPAIEKVVQTPIVGIWSEGKLVEVLQGFRARSYVLSLTIKVATAE